MQKYGKSTLLALTAIWVWQIPSAMAQDDEGQEQPADDPAEPAAAVPDADDGDIVVYGTRLKGQLIIDQPPLAEYDEADIAAFGAGKFAKATEIF